jgi:hypothetical protein
MSTWQARRYYSSDEQSQIISKLIQKNILAAAETKKIQDDLIQLGDLSDSQLNITEQIESKVASVFTVWKLPIEPDNNQCRLWLHATNCCLLSDLSDFGALAKFYGRYPKLVEGYDDGVTGNVLNPYLDGITNYLRVKDNPNIRLNNIVGTKAGITIFLRAYSTSLSLSLDGSKRFFFSKIDDDLITYGYEAFADPTGVIYFVVRQNGVDYKNKTASPALTPQRDYSDFDSADYKAVDFYTTAQPVYSPDDLIDDYVFTFKFSDHTMQIFKNGVSLTLASASAEPAVFPPAISNPPPLNNANLLVVTMTASGGTNVAFSNDANLTTRWEQLSLPAFLVADKGQIKTVGYAQIAWYRGSLGRIQNFQILISDDNVTFVSVYTGQGLGTDALQRYDFPDVTGRYVKLLITANSEGASASVYEFQVWGFDPISVVYPITTMYNVPITGGDYFDLYSTPQSSSTDPVFGVTGTNSTDVQLRVDSGKTTVYTIGGSGTGIPIHAAGTLVTVFGPVSGSASSESLGTVTNNVSICIEYVANNSSVFVGKTISRLDVKMSRHGNPSGAVGAGIWDISAGTQLYASPTSVNASSLSLDTSGYVTYTFDFSTNNHVMAFDDGIGVAYVGSDSSNFVNVAVILSPTGGNDGGLTYAAADVSGAWAAINGTNVADFAMTAYTGSGAATHIVAEYINSTSSVFYNKIISQVTVKMSKTGSPSGNIFCRIRKVGGTTIAADATIAATTLTTSFVAYTFNFTGNAYATVLNDQLEVQFDGPAGPDWVNVQFDTSGYDGTNSVLRTQDTSNAWTLDTAKDLAGTMLINNASPIVSAGEYIDDNTSVLFGKILNKVTFKLAKVGAPTGNIVCYILLSGGSSVQSTTTISAATLPVSTGSNYVATDFLFSANAHVGAVGDTIYVYFNGGDPSNYVVVQREVGSASGDSVHTTMRTQLLSAAWTNTTTDDVACTFYISNIIPATTQNRVVMNCAGDFGTFINHVLNDFTFYLKKLGAPTGTIYFRIRDINDAVVQDLGNFAATSLTTSNTTIHFVNIPVFTHRLVKGDKICVEYTSVTGVSADRVQVQQNDRSWFGDPDTNEQGYNNISYTTVSNRIFAGIYKEGGQTVIFQEIDLASEDIVVQPGYSHDLFIAVNAEFEQQAQTWTLKQGFWKGIFSQFRIYYDLLTLAQIQNLYANKISISSINYGEVLTGGDIMSLQP